MQVKDATNKTNHLNIVEVNYTNCGYKLLSCDSVFDFYLLCMAL